ncbi:HAD family hydrolase [Yoonia sp. 208BN28-4]|uniref:HAD family hydrolase n=1 Tax=Yoonia sp. 208BN28-4 TaxID=3126505 RepID=UPI0030AACAAC
MFDKDGTLYDFNATWGAWAHMMLMTEAAGSASRFAALADTLGFDPEAKRFRAGSIVIAETVDVVADAILPHLPDPDKPALMERMKAAATSVPQQEAADLRGLLQNLRGRGLKLGVATNDAEAPARAHLGRSDIVPLFDFIAGADSGFGGKPQTGQLQAFCDQTGLAAAKCAMVGDSLHDLHAGRAAGMVTVGVLTGPAPAEELAPHADVVLASVADIPAWLDRA